MATCSCCHGTGMVFDIVEDIEAEESVLEEKPCPACEGCGHID